MMIQLWLKILEKMCIFYKQKCKRVAKQRSVAECGLKNIIEKKTSSGDHATTIGM